MGTSSQEFVPPGNSGRFTTAFLALCLHDWPQNVRELEKMMAEAVRYANGRAEISLEDLPVRLQERVPADSESEDSPSRRPRPTKAEMEALLERHRGNVAEVARTLDRQWNVVWRWIRQDGVVVEKYRN